MNHDAKCKKKKKRASPLVTPKSTTFLDIGDVGRHLGHNQWYQKYVIHIQCAHYCVKKHQTPDRVLHTDCGGTVLRADFHISCHFSAFPTPRLIYSYSYVRITWVTIEAYIFHTNVKLCPVADMGSCYFQQKYCKTDCSFLN